MVFPYQSTERIYLEDDNLCMLMVFGYFNDIL
jgi:hypothetical protein